MDNWMRERKERDNATLPVTSLPELAWLAWMKEANTSREPPRRESPSEADATGPLGLKED